MSEEQDYEWLPETESGWTADPYEVGFGKCSHMRCDRPAVALFYRTTNRGYGQRPRRYRCCDLPEHMYGRRIRDGVVEWPYRIGSPAYERAKGTAPNAQGGARRAQEG